MTILNYIKTWAKPCDLLIETLILMGKNPIKCNLNPASLS
jgi:hypothetical protein